MQCNRKGCSTTNAALEKLDHVLPVVYHATYDVLRRRIIMIHVLGHVLCLDEGVLLTASLCLLFKHCPSSAAQEKLGHKIRISAKIVLSSFF